MTGLISREDLVLSLPQMVWLAFAAWGWLTARDLRRWVPLFLVGSLVMFWGARLCFDTRVTWNQLARFDGRIMTLQEMAYLNHLKFQPPIWNWFLAIWSIYGWQQVFAVGVSGIIIAAEYELYGSALTCALGACPLCVLVVSQPLNGLYALACVLLGRVAWHRGRRVWAVAWIVLACSVKYTVYALMPVLVWEFGLWSLGILAGVGAYWIACWQSESLLVVRQADFLVNMFSLGAVGMARHGDMGRVVSRNVGRLDRLWRSGPAMLFYAWPLMGAVPWSVVSLGVLMLLGGGNVKYLIVLAGVLPIHGRDAKNSS